MYIPLFVLTCVIIYCCRLATKKYGQIANPICIFAPLYFVQNVIAPIVFYEMGLLDDFGSAAARSVWLSTLYFIGIVCAFYFKRTPFKKMFAYVLPKGEPRGITTGALIFFGVTFICLMVASGVGTMWLTAPRTAYQLHRMNVGMLWSLSEAFLIMAFCGILVQQQSKAKIFLYCFLFAFLAYFLGSKGFMLMYFVIAIVYIQHRLKPFSITALGITAIGIIFAQLLMQIVQGTAKDYSDAILYFDYFSNTAMFLHGFNEFKFTFGATMLGDLWFYVPRTLYHAKPLTYGGSIIMDHFYPGQAESGGTPGILSWAEAYLDFGIPGVFASGLLSGFVAKAAYELFRDSNSSVSLLLFAQIGFLFGTGVFVSAPILIFILWIAAVFSTTKFTHRILAGGVAFSKLENKRTAQVQHYTG